MAEYVVTATILVVQGRCQRGNVNVGGMGTYSWLSLTSPVMAVNPIKGTAGSDMFLTWKHSDQSSPRTKIRHCRSGGGGWGLTSSVLDLHLRTAKCET